MSEENVPKLRLKPRLTKDAPPAPAPVTPPAAPAPAEPPRNLPPLAPPPEDRPLRLKPRLAGEPGPAPAAEKAPVPAAPAGNPPAVPSPAAVGGAPAQIFPPPKLSLKPGPKPGAAPGDDSPANAPGPNPGPTNAVMPGEPLPRVLNAPPPPGMGSVRDKVLMDQEPAEIAIMRKVSSMPFPPPMSNLPPLLGSEEDVLRGESRKGSGKGNFLSAVVGIILLGVVALAAFLAYKRFFPSTPRSAPAVVSTPAPAPVAKVKPATTPPAPAISVAANALPANKPAAAQPEASAPADNPPAAGPAATVDEPAAAPAPAAPVGPPVPSLAFKAWVLNLQVRGVRGGANPRVFIEHTSYAPGDLVNPELGIVFVGYDSESGILTFKDRAGAIAEHRN